MSFAWSKKVVRVVPAPPPQELVNQPEPELVQVVELPVVDDKISSIEHKNGECLVSARKEDDEADEVKGDVCQGEGSGTGDQGSEEDMARVEDEESSSPRTSLKK